MIRGDASSRYWHPGLMPYHGGFEAPTAGTVTKAERRGAAFAPRPRSKADVMGFGV